MSADDRPGDSGAVTEVMAVRERVALARARDALLGAKAPRVLAGRYRLEGRLGSGGMGDVFEAVDPELDRRVAVKFVRLGPRSDATKTRIRLVREARSLARLAHPNVVPIYDVGSEGEEVYLVMELVRGRPLQGWLREEHSPDEILDLLISAGRGLAAAHAADIVHRDFKPANVVVGDDGRARVLDFGLAVRGVTDDDLPPTLQGELEEPADHLHLTRTGAVLGTPRYMSPEQHRGEANDPRVDVFAFFVVLYEALVGTEPYVERTVEGLAKLKHAGPPPRPEAIDRRLWRVVARGLEAHPDDRFPTMTAALDALERARRPRRRRVVALGVLGMAGVAVSGVALSSEDRCVQSGSERIESTWTARRAEVEHALEATGLPHAATTWTLISEAMDGYAEAWDRSHRVLCEAGRRGTLDDEQLDRRMRCLERARGTVDVLLSSVVQRPDEATMHKLVDAIDGLDEPATCETERTDATEGYPRPEDPAIAEEVERVRDRLAQARVLGVAGRADEARPLVEACEADAERLDWEPLRAETDAARGQLHFRQGEPGLAREALDRAWERAVAQGHDRMAMEIALTRVEVDSAHLDEPEPAAVWVSRAEAWMLRTGSDPGTRLRYLDAASGLERQAGHYERAQSLGEQAVALARERGDQGMLASALNTLALTLADTGRYERAGEIFEEALAIRRERQGEDHPSVALAYNNMGWTLVNQGRPEQARPLLEEAVARATRSLGPEHPEVAGYIANVGISYSKEGDHDSALRYLSQALELRERRYGPEHPAVGRSLIDLAATNAMAGDLATARPLYQRAESIFATSLGAEHPHRGVVLMALGRIELDAGNAAQAVERLEAALAIFAASLPDDHPYAVGARSSLAEARAR